MAEWEKDSLPSLMDFQGLHQYPHPISDCLTCPTHPIHFLESNLEGDVSVLVPKLKNYLQMRTQSLVKGSNKISMKNFRIILHNHKVYNRSQPNPANVRLIQYMQNIVTYLTNSMIFGKNVLDIKCVFDFLYNFV